MSTAVTERDEHKRLSGPGWPITVLLLGYPLWWLLGMTSFILVLAAVPMTLTLARRRTIAVPPAFGWWLLFLACVVASAAMLGLTAPGTVEGTFTGRLPGFTLRLLNYLAATVAMLYVINLREEQFSTRRLVRLQAFFFGVVVTGGVAGILLPDREFTSPLNYVLPGSVTSNRFAHSLLHPSLAQVQGVLGYEAPRPSAPFVFTNIWGNNLSLLMVWFVVAMWVWGGTRSKIICGVVLAVSLVPIIYSLNRGLWIGLVAALLYLSVRSAMHGRIQVLLGVGLAGFIVTSLVLISPLYTVIQERIANPHSNTARESTSGAAVTAALSSPVLGYGSTRAVVGSAQSAAVGRSASCPQCGNAAIGGAGQLWLLLIAQGFTGVVLYVGFFARTLWIYRRDHSPVAMGGFLVLGLGLLYLPVYGAAGSPLGLYMLAVALLYRQRQQAEQAALAGDGVEDPRFLPLAPRTVS